MTAIHNSRIKRNSLVDKQNLKIVQSETIIKIDCERNNTSVKDYNFKADD